MSNLKELNGRLTGQPYVTGYCPSKDDATLFTEMFGNNKNVIQWAARMASYYQCERDELLQGGPAASAAPVAKKTEAPKKEEKKPAPADDDEDDLFGEQTEEEKQALADKKKADAEKKSAKKAVIAKSSILIDIKPWDDTTDLKELGKLLKEKEVDGLIWGAQKLVPVAYGVHKLQQLIVIEDDKISGEDLEDIITGFEDYVQSMDIQVWNKV